MLYAINSDIERVSVHNPGPAPYFCPACLQTLTIDTITKDYYKHKKKVKKQTNFTEFETTIPEMKYFKHPNNFCLMEPETKFHIIAKNNVSKLLTQNKILHHIDYQINDIVCDIYIPDQKVAIELQNITTTVMKMKDRIKHINEYNISVMWIFIRGDMFCNITQGHTTVLKAKMMEYILLNASSHLFNVDKEVYPYLYFDKQLIGMTIKQGANKTFIGENEALTKIKFRFYDTPIGYTAYMVKS